MHRTRMIYLAPLTSKDSETLFNWINERDLVIFNNSYKPTHEANHQTWFDNITLKKDVFIFGIKRTTDGKLIGSCQLNNLNLVHRHAELQIRIADDENRGKGLGSDAVRMLLRFAFKDLNFNRVFLNVFATNSRAIRAYEKIGFLREGELKQHVFIDGNYLNVVVMAVLREDYEEQGQRGNSVA